MDHNLNVGAEDGRRAWDIPTRGRDEKILAQPLRLVLHEKPIPDRTICALAARG
jgi:hypothetical protein